MPMLTRLGGAFILALAATIAVFIHRFAIGHLRLVFELLHRINRRAVEHARWFRFDHHRVNHSAERRNRKLDDDIAFDPPLGSPARIGRGDFHDGHHLTVTTGPGETGVQCQICREIQRANGQIR